jgi:hypothetical protein
MGKRQCELEGCSKQARKGGHCKAHGRHPGGTHGGGERCQEEVSACIGELPCRGEHSGCGFAVCCSLVL